MSTLKEILYQELELKISTNDEGISFDPLIFRDLDLGGRYQEEVLCLFEMAYETHAGIKFPSSFRSPHGLIFNLRWDRRSSYSLIHDKGSYYLAHHGEVLFAVEFVERPDYYRLKTSDGTPMSTIAPYVQEGSVLISYSNECALKEKGQDCKFCNINATKDTYGEIEGIGWKTPKQVGETVAAAYREFSEGARRVNLTGGFVAERREVEYYLDVADSIKEHTGLEDFNGLAAIGAPLDLSVIEKYKEAGYRTIASNIEIWDKNIFKAICPGKEQQCGGWDHWLKVLDHEVKVFGHGRVRSNLVAGIEPKDSTLEGIEYLASRGVIALATVWNPNPGSALEGHRAPEPAWYFDLFKKIFAIHRKYGFTYEELYDCSGATGIISDLYRIEDETLPVFKSLVA
ncbi:MAG: nitrogen fixation protein NifB [Chlorobiaceae bacterium]|nr:nitrogen fixation protein NifB [Chlorobiaceae bacterium]